MEDSRNRRYVAIIMRLLYQYFQVNTHELGRLTNQYPAAEAPWSLQVFNQYFDRDIYLPDYNLREVLTVSTQPVDSSTQWSAS